MLYMCAMVWNAHCLMYLCVVHAYVVFNCCIANWAHSNPIFIRNHAFCNCIPDCPDVIFNCLVLLSVTVVLMCRLVVVVCDCGCYAWLCNAVVGVCESVVANKFALVELHPICIVLFFSFPRLSRLTLSWLPTRPLCPVRLHFELIVLKFKFAFDVQTSPLFVQVGPVLCQL